MKWLLGVDLRPAGEGAIAFARWLTDSEDTPGAHTFVSLHSVEGWDSMLARGDADEEALERFARTAVEATLDRASLRGEAARIVHGSSAEDALAKAAGTFGVDALLIGRRSPRDGDEIVRLGRVARRLVRRLPVPVVVAPPDLSLDAVGKGPILLAATSDETADGAAGFARALADRVDRPIHVITAVPEAFPSGVSYLPTAAYDPLVRKRMEGEVRAWREEQGLAAARLELVEGPPIPVILNAVERLDPCILICGSRLLSPTDRFFQSSVGSSLAAAARCAVAVVPPSG